jgi:hypothetical protein
MSPRERHQFDLEVLSIAAEERGYIRRNPRPSVAIDDEDVPPPPKTSIYLADELAELGGTTLRLTVPKGQENGLAYGRRYRVTLEPLFEERDAA